MTKQLLKAATMFVGIIALAFASALAASAQNSRSLVVNIPFDFNIRGKMLPAGEYNVTNASIADSMILTIKRSDGRGNAVVLTKTIESRDAQSESRLVFNRYGERYFLSQVWTLGSAQGRELYKSKQERASESELAKNNQKAETVTLAASAQ